MPIALAIANYLYNSGYIAFLVIDEDDYVLSPSGIPHYVMASVSLVAMGFETMQQNL